MRKRANSDRYSDIRPWVQRAVAAEDEKPKQVLWRNAPDGDRIQDERFKRIKFLRKHGKQNSKASALADRLDACESPNRCLSGACPECGWLLQRWFVRQSKNVINSELDNCDVELVAITIVPATPIVCPGRLHEFSSINFQRRLKDAFAKMQLGIALGGIDFSFNEDRKRKYQPFWCIHAYIITTTPNKRRLSRALRKLFKRVKRRIPIPIKIVPFENRARRRSYALKMEFRRRIGYRETTLRKGRLKNGQNASWDKLCAKERLELFFYLDQIGLAARTIFFGVKPINNSTGVKLNKASVSSESNKSTEDCKSRLQDRLLD